MPVERVRGERPEDRSWRADALAGSKHSRLADQLLLPLESRDVDRAQEICAAICRRVLRDFAPALILLPQPERRRAQALTAYGLTLFDFVRQTGLEGERLAAVNRCEFDLELALDGRPAGQPIFLVMAQLDAARAWPRQGFDRLHAVARRRCAMSRPVDRPRAEREATELGTALTWLLLGAEPPTTMARFASALLRLRALLDLGEDVRRHRAQLPVRELPESWDPASPHLSSRLELVVAAECERLAPHLRSTAAVEQTPPRQRAAARYLRLAALGLLRQVENLGGRVVDSAPSLALGARLLLLARCRWLAR